MRVIKVKIPNNIIRLKSFHEGKVVLVNVNLIAVVEGYYTTEMSDAGSSVFMSGNVDALRVRESVEEIERLICTI